MKYLLGMLFCAFMLGGMYISDLKDRLMFINELNVAMQSLEHLEELKRLPIEDQANHFIHHLESNVDRAFLFEKAINDMYTFEAIKRRLIIFLDTLSGSYMKSSFENIDLQALADYRKENPILIYSDTYKHCYTNEHFKIEYINKEIFDIQVALREFGVNEYSLELPMCEENKK